MLHDFLASLLEIPYDSIYRIDVLNSEVLPETAEGKFSRMDLKLLVDNRLINVEMRISAKSNFKDRVLYYWSKMYSKNWLNETSELGCGDDITLIMAYYN